MWKVLMLLGVLALRRAVVLADYNPSSECPTVDGPDSVYFPDPNCSLFWQCSNGVAYQHTCPADLHFNRHLNVCDYPYRAGCETSTTEQVVTTVVPVTTTQKPSASEPTCKPQPTRCTCTCEAIPDDEPITTPIWTTPVPPNESTPRPCDTTTAEVPKGSCDDLSSLCPAVDGEYPVYIPLANCSAFCQCSNGQAHYHPCPDGLHFNPSLNVCDWPHDAGCTGESGTTSSTAPPPCESATCSSTTPSDRDSCDELSGLCPAVDGEYPVYIPLANCSAFCQCSNGQAHYHPCPDGLHFNPSLNVCDWPHDAGCTGESGTTSSAAPPPCESSTCSSTTPSDRDSCDELSSLCPAVDGEYPVYIPLANCSAFCQCSNGQAHYHPCPEGLHFNPSLNVCDWPHDAGCTGESGTTSSAAPSPSSESTTSSSTTPSDRDSCDELSSLCPAVDGEYPVYIPLANCSAFCQCSNGQAHYHPCPDGLHFNPSLNVCDWPLDAGCTGESGTTSSAAPPSSSESTTSSSTTPSDRDSCDELSSLCPAVDGEYPVYIPLANCSAFCQCSNGQAHYHPCPDGLHFNPSLNVCDWPHDAGCTGESGTTSSAAPPSSSESTTSSSTTPSDRDSCDELSNLCPAADGEYPVYIPLANCSAFCQCSNGAAYYHPCPEGLHFNPSLNVCDWPHDAGCTGESGTTSSAAPPPSSESTTSSSTIPSDRDSCDNLSSLCPVVDGEYPVYIPLANCSAFCQCSNGAAYYHPCPEGLHFNPSKNVCDWPHDAGCTGETGTTSSTVPPATSQSTTPSSTTPNDRDSCDELSSLCPAVDGEYPVYIALANCSAFCQCSNGAAYYYPCPSDLHFNPTKNVCDYQQEAGCTGVAGTTPTTQKPEPTTVSLDTICQTDSSQVKAHPSDCTSYLSCFNGKADVMKCPDGLHFDPTLYVCNWPAQVQCTSSAA